MRNGPSQSAEQGHVARESGNASLPPIDRRAFLQLFSIGAMGLFANSAEAQDDQKVYLDLLEGMKHRRQPKRQEAADTFVALANKEVQETLRYSRRKVLLQPTGDFDYNRHVTNVRAAIEKKERELGLLIPSVFSAPPIYEKEGHTETIESAFAQLSLSTGQFLTTRYTPRSYLEQRIPTRGLHGKTFWEALHSMQTKDGVRPSVSSNNHGQLYVHPSEQPQEMFATEGALMGTLQSYENIGSMRITLQSESKMKIWHWKDAKVTITNADGKKIPMQTNYTWGQDNLGIFFSPPEATKQGEKVSVTLECTIEAMHNESVLIQDLEQKEKFHRDDYRARYEGIAEQDKEFEILGFLEPREGINIVSTRFGCTVFGKNGREIPIIKSESPELITHERYTWRTAAKPAQVFLHLPNFDVVSTKHTLHFKDVQLHSKK